jgi:protein-tyrosine phosphatase
MSTDPHRGRRVPFEGATNFRDLGGYPTVDGGTTRWGKVYRSDGLQSLTDDDVDRFEQLGIKVVYDLRREVRWGNKTVRNSCEGST